MNCEIDAYQDSDGTWWYGFDAAVARVLDMEKMLQMECDRKYRPWLVENDDV